jgi:hypothetical protein
MVPLSVQCFRMPRYSNLLTVPAVGAFREAASHSVGQSDEVRDFPASPLNSIPHRFGVWDLKCRVATSRHQPVSISIPRRFLALSLDRARPSSESFPDWNLLAGSLCIAHLRLRSPHKTPFDSMSIATSRAHNSPSRLRQEVPGPCPSG